MIELSDTTGFKTVAGIRYVYDLGADAYIPVMPQAHSNDVNTEWSDELHKSDERVGAMAHDLGTMPAEYLTRPTQPDPIYTYLAPNRRNGDDARPDYQ